MLHVAEAQPVDQELVKMELSVISAVKLATIQKQLFVKTKTAQVRQIEILDFEICARIFRII